MNTHPYLLADEIPVKKLQLGCGGNYLAQRGWLDTDYTPLAQHVLRLDASLPFPFPSIHLAMGHQHHFNDRVHGPLLS